MAALWAARAWPGIALPLGVAGLVLAIMGGLDVPDLDQHLPLLDHRDGLTHGLLPALAAAAWRWLRPLAAGLAIGIALHLSADLFPAAMTGYATVKLPFAGSLGRWSYAWLLANAAGGIALFAALLDRRWPGVVRLGVAAGAVLLGLTYLARVDGGWWAIAGYAAIGAGIYRVRARRSFDRG